MGRARPGRGKTSRVTIERRERMALALEMRRESSTYEEIADELGISRTQAYKDVSEAIAEIVDVETAAEVRGLELDRLDIMMKPLLKVVQQADVVREFETEALQVELLEVGEADNPRDQAQLERDFDRKLEKTIKRTDAAFDRMFKAVDRSIKIQDRRAKLLGLDNPENNDVTVSDVKAWLNEKMGVDRG